MKRALFVFLACLSLAGCTTASNFYTVPDPNGVNATIGQRLADLPHWMGGLPADAPPRAGTPEYDAWMAARAKEAARPKSGNPKPDTAH
ncbi:hypothetical protein EAS61_35170 [Bradyrhizobium zhanjiangense]|uniref:Lipoprotein n=1 Tax=Bradyrhizobium zhanjiangense TaxID=1325107 RepID=A0A4Q0Q9P3_9BRAD|nr:hypothetical protein EAS61_35170 [Bradyrhizobium zhanjiangense]